MIFIHDRIFLVDHQSVVPGIERVFDDHAEGCNGQRWPVDGEVSQAQSLRFKNPDADNRRLEVEFRAAEIHVKIGNAVGYGYLALGILPDRPMRRAIPVLVYIATRRQSASWGVQVGAEGWPLKRVNSLRNHKMVGAGADRFRHDRREISIYCFPRPYDPRIGTRTLRAFNQYLDLLSVRGREALAYVRRWVVGQPGRRRNDLGINRWVGMTNCRAGRPQDHETRPLHDKPSHRSSRYNNRRASAAL